jgi:hypothetical protein
MKIADQKMNDVLLNFKTRHFTIGAPLVAQKHNFACASGKLFAIED